MRHRSIWFALLSMVLVRLTKAVAKITKLLMGRIRGARKKHPEEH